MPAVALAVAVTLARPLASVTAELALSVALAPDDGALKLDRRPRERRRWQNSRSTRPPVEH